MQAAQMTETPPGRAGAATAGSLVLGAMIAGAAVGLAGGVLPSSWSCTPPDRPSRRAWCSLSSSCLHRA